METKYIDEAVTWLSNDEVDEGFIPLEAEPFIIRDESGLALHLGDGVTEGGILVAVESPGAGASGPANIINRPSVITPVNQATDVVAQPLITTSQYVGTGTAEGEHAGTHWQIATDLDFTNLVVDTGLDILSLTTLDLAAEGVTLADATHYVRVRYESTTGVLSEWSAVNSFTVMGDALQGYSYEALVSGTPLVGGQPHPFTLNSAGTRLAVGLPDNNSIVVKDLVDGVWTSGISLNPEAVGAEAKFGHRLSISGDGQVIVAVSRVLPGEEENTYEGVRLHYYVNDGGVWSEYFIANIISEANAISVKDLAVDATGDTVIVTTPEYVDNSLHYIKRSGGMWMTEQVINPASLTHAGSADFGREVALSADGQHLLVMDVNPFQDTNGGIHEFTLQDGLYEQDTLRAFSRTGSWTSLNYGHRLAIAGDGSCYALIRGDDADSSIARMNWVDGSGWTLGNEVTDLDNPTDNQLTNLSINADGSRWVVSVPASDNGRGSLYVMDWSANELYQSVAIGTPSPGTTNIYGGQVILASAPERIFINHTTDGSYVAVID